MTSSINILEIITRMKINREQRIIFKRREESSYGNGNIMDKRYIMLNSNMWDTALKKIWETHAHITDIMKCVNIASA